MPSEIVVVLVVAIAVLVAAGLVWHFLRRSRAAKARANATTEYPDRGVLVAADVFRAAGSDPDAIWDALEVAAAPIAVEYYPISDAELSKLRTVPVVNSAAQQAMANVIKAVNPKSPTLFRAVLPKGAELVKAVGKSGFRGFSRSGGKTVHAVLKPVAVGGAVAAGWPVFAIAGTVMVVDMVAQREQRIHQRRVQSLLDRQEKRHYAKRIASQRTADDALSTAISLMLDGREPAMENAVDRAGIEFHLATQFLQDYAGVIDLLADDQGHVDYRILEEKLGGKDKDVDHFVREFHLASAAVAIKRKALVAHAASVALADPTNPYAALRTVFEAQAEQLEKTEAALAVLGEQLSKVELKGRWQDSIIDRVRRSDRSVAARQQRFRNQFMLTSENDNSAELAYLVMPSGEIRQVAASDDDPPGLDPTTETSSDD